MKILALIMALALACLPATASALTQKETETLAKWAGAGKELHVYRVDPGMPDMANGAFTTDNFCSVMAWDIYCFDGPAVILIQGSNVPDDIAQHILFHEMTHYQQWKRGTVYDPDVVKVEWDADVGSINLLCIRGTDGISIMHKWLMWAKQRLGYTGDPNHGDLKDRLAYAAAHAWACRM